MGIAVAKETVRRLRQMALGREPKQHAAQRRGPRRQPRSQCQKFDVLNAEEGTRTEVSDGDVIPQRS